MSNAPAKRALVTGATGFIGGNLAARLQGDGWETHAVIRTTSQAGAVWQVLGESRVHVHDGSTEGMLAIVQQVQPTHIFHVASLFLAQHRADQVTTLVRSNVEFAAQLAEAAAVVKVPYFINTGTSWQHFEDAEFNPVNLYAATKEAGAGILRYYAEAGVFRVLNLELFDTYGPNDPRPKLFTLLRKAAASGETLAMSAGDQLIDLVFIDDILDAYTTAAEYIAQSSSFNTFAVSSGAPLPLREMVGVWSKVTGRPLNIQWGARPYRPREVMVPWSRGKSLPSWKPAVGLERGIRKMEGLA